MAFDWITHFFKKKQRLIDLNQSQINQSITQSITETNQQDSSTVLNEPIELEKESLQLGIAAGYTGRAIHDIMRTLERIELNLPNKDWFSFRLEELLKEHDNNEQKRFEQLQTLINSLLTTAELAPEPVKTQLISQIIAVQDELNRPRIQELIKRIKEKGEISYADLATQMEISQDGIRGMLSIIARKMPEIERFDKEKKGWVRFKSINQS